MKSSRLRMVLNTHASLAPRLELAASNGLT